MHQWKENLSPSLKSVVLTRCSFHTLSSSPILEFESFSKKLEKRISKFRGASFISIPLFSILSNQVKPFYIFTITTISETLANHQKSLIDWSMEAKINRFFDSVGSFFSGNSENIPWCDHDIIAGCEKEVREAVTEEQKRDSVMRLSWALVHSKDQADVNRGIAMLEASLANSSSSLVTREKLYLLAVGHYRNGDYPRSRQLVDHCLEIEPDWRQARTLKKAVEDKIAKDGLIGVGIATTAVGLVIGGIAAALVRKS
ncbi:Mitochondria fission 1 protein [Rhynchospora pubera]|uniref:Mitochondria fission 1 protein n=2 Tax=Rhynchospora pubera TaxID=906938 RepID=A0AAV8EH38_9POAL|nr:Mitochondria fission 1 protein [Rhynchospora pubera]KAJ4779500.1 Mitochondria fission 1 protein [Rhynchospora pubera]